MIQQKEFYLLEAAMACTPVTWTDFGRSRDGGRLGRHRYIKCIEEVCARRDWWAAKPDATTMGPPRREYSEDDYPERFDIPEQVDEYYLYMLDDQQESNVLAVLQDIRNSIKNGKLTYLASHQVTAVEFAEWWRERATPETPVPLILAPYLIQRADVSSSSERYNAADRWTDEMKLAEEVWGKYWSDPTSDNFAARARDITAWIMKRAKEMNIPMKQNMAESIQNVSRHPGHRGGGLKK